MRTRDNKIALLLCLSLLAGTWACYHGVLAQPFLSFDDRTYVVENLHVLPGLTWSGVGWAFSTGYFCSWHPLTWLSYMLDCSLYGLNPRGHHLTNLLFHIANSFLLFFWLRKLTGSLWRSFLVAALFAWHPVHVESVAWIAERKDVLSTFFFLLTLMAYTRFASPQTDFSGVSGGKRHGYYALALLLFALGLMSKPMLVTLPCVLLLLDWWPLNRVPRPVTNVRALWPVLWEKIPFFALSFAASVVTYLVQKQGGAVASLQAVPFTARIANAIVTYGLYILKIFWPSRLSAIYPLPNHWPVLTVAAAAVLLLAVSWLVFSNLSRRGYLAAGWLWFLGTLVPVIGFIQVGSQSMADRYTYIPSIGLFIALIWGLEELLRSMPLVVRQAAPIAVTATCVACVLVTANQVRYWDNSEALFRHALDVTHDNYMACDGLAKALDDSGDKAEGLKYHLETVRLAPSYPQGQYNLGTALIHQGRASEAIEHLRLAVELSPRFARAQHGLGTALLQAGRFEEAMPCFTAALQLDPEDADAHHAYGILLLRFSKPAEAVNEFGEVLRLNPGHLEARRNMGVALAQLGRIREALPFFAEVARLAPQDPAMRFNLALALYDLDRPAEAETEFAEAIRLNPQDANSHYRMARACARQGKSAEAIEHYQAALRLQPDYPNARNELAKLVQ